MNKNKWVIVLLLIIIVLLVYVAFIQKKSPVVVPLSPGDNTSVDKNIIQNNKVTNNNSVKEDSVIKESVQIYAEKNTGEPIVGTMGEQMKIVASSTIPATVTYTIKYKTAALVPNAVAEESIQTQTVSIPVGKTVLRGIVAFDGKVDISFTYIKN